MQKLNTTAVYILAILGFVCCCFAIGWIPALIAVILAVKGVKKYEENPDMYSNGASMKSAKVVAIVALVISILYAIYAIYFLLQFEGECEFWNWYLEQADQNPAATEEQLQPIYDRMEEVGCM